MVSLRRWLAFDSVAWIVPLIVATFLAASMAWISAFNAHPDEIHHARAADYYRTHWLPPQFGDPDAVPSYSRYGTSYLHERDIVYLLAGKWSLIVAPVVGNSDLSYRLFNLMLLAAIAFAFVRKREARPLLVPLVLSAQVWYVFSYFNADALALAAALFVAYQIIARGSVFNAALDSKTRMRWLGGVLLLGFGFGLLLLAKRNYYIVLAFLAAYVMLREVGLRASFGVAFCTLIGIGWYFRAPPDVPSWLYGCTALVVAGFVVLDIRARVSDPAFRRRVGTFIAAGGVGVVLFLPRVAFDKLVVENSANELYSIEATAEVFAADGFKPSQIAKGVAESEFRLRVGGTPYLKMLFSGNHWAWISFQSLVGCYGYMTIFSRDRFYAVVGVVYLVFLALLGYGAWRSGDGAARNSLAIASLYALLVVLVSSLYSWTSALQAQGRYLFPAFVMFGMAIADMRGRLPAAAPVAAVLAFVLAVYSFCDVGLILIPKS
jgi:hypothetical protein